MIKKLLFSLTLCVACLLPAYRAFASNTINSVSIIGDTLKGVPKCMHYKIVGLCFWLRCSADGCYTETTLKIDQYLPDVVVSVYTQHNNNPWWFAQHIEDSVFYQAGKAQISHFAHFKLGSGDEHDNSHRDINNKFHEVDIMGNPALFLLSGYDVMLPSAVMPYTPYYSSLMDAYAWRYDAKAAAVDALRVSTIITTLGQPHLYMPLSNACGSHCSVYPVKENSKNAQYQMIYPKVENQCTVFGGSDITSVTLWETNASSKGHDRYVWILWRHYHGCVQDHGAKYLGSINF